MTESPKYYRTFDEVEKEEDMKTIGCRWVMTQKEKNDVQKKLCKARLVERGFQKEIKPQSDSPTASMDSFKLIVTLLANEGFKLISIDIHAAFLQAMILDLDVFVIPAADIRKQGKVLILLKQL